MVHLNDLGGFEVRGRERGKLHGQDGAHRKVGCNQDGAPRLAGVIADARVGFRRPPGRTDDHVHAGIDEGVHVGFGHGGDGEVDGDVGAVDAVGVDLIARVQLGHDLHVRGVAHRVDDGRSHAAICPGHCHAYHCSPCAR